MVLKGLAARKMKKEKLKGRPERSLFVSFKIGTEREKVVEILSNAHPEVERVFLPRARLPKFVYVLCKGAAERDAVKASINQLRNEDMGRIYAKYPKPPKVVEKSPLSRREIDRCTLVLELIPAELDTEEIEKAFPKAIKVDRFNKRRCYVHFKKAKEAMKARMQSTEIAGHKVTIKFNKMEKASENSSTDLPATEGAGQESE